ncbi:MAG: hypothetical protein IJJ23_00025 [Clostridia bacterium]|nr:hypothetical protein [Clostridia bacterium]
MPIQFKNRGDSSNVRFTKESLREAGISNADFGGNLNLSDEIERDAPTGSEI